MTIAALSHGFRHQWYGLVLGLGALALLFMGLQEVRRPRVAPAEQGLVDLEDRSIRRAKRRLTPDEATLRGVSLVDRKPKEGPGATR